MKEAAGEANMTVITIILIGVVAVIGGIFVPRLLASMDARSCCTENGGQWKDGACSIANLKCADRTNDVKK